MTLECRNSKTFGPFLRKPYKALFINTPQIPKMYKGIRKKKKGEFKDCQVSTN
jgi:hypothetical protein